MGEVWGMIKRMGGNRRQWEYPVLTFEEKIAVSDKEKLEVMVKSFTKVHSSEILSEEERRRRAIHLNLHLQMINRKNESGEAIDEPFTLAEMVRAIKRAKPTSPGKDQICYVMLKQLGKRSLLKLFELCNKLKEGKGRNTMDSVLRLETEIRKAQANKESVVAVFFYIEKAYDMGDKEGLLIKLNKMGVGGRAFNWIKDFLFGRKIQVRIGVDMSNLYMVENSTPQGSVISPLLFIIMINDVFGQGPEDIGRSLFADNGACVKEEGMWNIL